MKAGAALVLWVVFAGEAVARDRTFLWKSSTRYEFQRFEKDRADWHVLTVTIERRFRLGSVALEGFRVSRFSKWDEGAAVDGYLGLWKRAYGNLRVQGVVDPDVMPITDAYVEAFQGFGKGWEMSISYRNMNFEKSLVNIPGLSVGRYIGNGYYRAKATVSPSHGELGLLGAGSARYYLATADDYVEVGGGAGRQVIVLGAGPELDFRYNGYLLAKGQTFFTRYFGGAVVVSFNAAERTPWGLGGSVSVLGRW